MALLSTLALILVSCVTILYVYFKYSFEYWKSRNIPCDKPSIPYGNIKGLGKNAHPAHFIKNIYDKYKSTGQKICGVYFLTRPIAIVLDLELVKCVLVKDFSNFNERGLYYNEQDEPLSAHLFTLDGESWRKLRAKITPTFTTGKMKFMFPTIVEVGERFRDHLNEIVDKHDQLEIRDLLARFTTDVIGTCAFGIECNTMKDPNADFIRYGRDVFGRRRHSVILLSLIGGFPNMSRRLHVKSIPDDITEFFMRVVRETVEYREKNDVNRNDFMDLLIKLKNQKTSDKTKLITLNELAGQAFVFFVAGFETSSTTLTYCLYELAQNPKIQEKTRQIIRKAFDKHDGTFTYEMMMDMPYIDQLLQETLRKYPPVGNLTRKTKSDYQVPGTNAVIEKGIDVAIPVYAIHHDPEYYPNPGQFDPNRFESDEIKKRDAMAWLPFGDGPRNCIGLRFGMMQARIGLIILLNNFEFSLGSNTSVPLKFDPKTFILTPESGVYLKIKAIKT